MAAVVGWGAAGAGQLGIAVDDAPPAKTAVTPIASLPARTNFISTGQYHSLAVTEGGALYSTGRSEDLQLGREGTAHEWKRVGLLETFSIAAVAAGANFSIALDNKGTVLAWGGAERGQLGLGLEAMEKQQLRVPRPIKGLANIPIAMVAAGGRHVLALAYSGDVYSFGDNSDGQVGDGTFVPRHSPYLIPELRGKGIVSVVAGGRHSLALNGSGLIYSFGLNKQGQLGLGDTNNRHRPTFVPWSRGKFACAMAAGDFHTVVRTRTGHLAGFGSSQFGQLGLGVQEETVPYPREVADIQEHGRVVDVAAGRRHTVVIVVHGGRTRTFAFGANELRQLGLDPSHPAFERPMILAPVEVKSVSRLKPIKVVAGGDHCFAMYEREEVEDPTFVQRAFVPAGVLSPMLSRRGIAKRRFDGSLVATSPGPDVSAMIDGLTGAMPASPSTPMIVPMDTAADEPVGEGSPDGTGDQEGASSEKAEEPHVVAPPHALCRVNRQLLLELKEQTLAEEEQPQEASQRLERSVTRLVDQFYSSASCLNAAYIDYQRSYQQGRGVILDLAECRGTYDTLVRFDGSAVLRAMAGSLLKLARGVCLQAGIRFRDLHLEFVEDFLFLPIACECPLLLSPDQNGIALEFLLRAWHRCLQLPNCQEQMFEIYRQAGAPYFLRLVRVLQSYLTHLISARSGPTDPASLVCSVLKTFYDLNQSKPLLPADVFYNSTVGSTPEQMQEMQQWLMNPSAVFNYVRFPFLLSPVVKGQLLTALNSNTMVMHMAQNVLFGQGPMLLLLEVRRSHVYEDTVRQLRAAPQAALHCPLRIKFTGEEGVDEGGLIKEFFHLVLPKFFSRALEPMESEGIRWFWFSTPTEEHLEAYHCLGLLFGLAFMNRVLIPPMFPGVFYKLLLLPDIRPGSLDLNDMTSASPDLARGLRQLLDHEDRMEQEVFGLTFDIVLRDSHTGKYETRPLKPGGSDIAVTALNKQEYVSLYIYYFLYERISGSFDAFRLGFAQVVHNAQALALLRPEELEVLLCGVVEWNPGELQESAKYHNYSPADPPIKWFWEVLGELSNVEKRQFLTFVTGTSRVPVRGAKDITLVIQKAGDDPNRLLVSHTCYNVIDLPPYRSKEDLKKKLLLAINETEGFALV